MNREEVLKSPDYWTAKTQIELYNQAEKFMKDTGRSRSQLADYLGVSKGYVTQLLNGDYDKGIPIDNVSNYHSDREQILLVTSQTELNLYRLKIILRMTFV